MDIELGLYIVSPLFLILLVSLILYMFNIRNKLHYFSVALFLFSLSLFYASLTGGSHFGAERTGLEALAKILTFFTSFIAAAYFAITTWWRERFDLPL